MSSPAVQPLEPGLADSVSAPGDLAISCLGDLAGLELTRFQAWTGFRLDIAGRIARLLQFRSLALEADLQCQWHRSDFFWRESHRQLRVLLRSNAPWTAVSAQLTARDVPTSPDALKRALVDDFFAAAHLGLLRAAAALSADPPVPTSREFVHFGYLRGLLDAARSITMFTDDVLVEPASRLIAAETGARHWAAAMAVARDMTARFPDRRQFIERPMILEYHSTMDSLTKEGPLTARDVRRLQGGIERIEHLMRQRPAVVGFSLAGRLRRLLAIALANTDQLAQALLESQRGMDEAPGAEDAATTDAQLVDAMKALQTRMAPIVHELERSVNRRLTPEGQKLVDNAKRGFGAVNEYIKSPRRQELQDRLVALRNKEVWLDAGYAEPPAEWEARASVLFEAMNDVLGGAPQSAAELEERWRDRVADTQIADLDPQRAVDFLARRLWPQDAGGPPAEQASTPASPPQFTFQGHELVAGDEPLAFWIFSAQGWRIKTQMAVAIVLLVTVVCLAGFQSLRRARQDRAYAALLAASAAGDLVPTIDAGELFLSSPGLHEDRRTSEVKAIYAEALVRWFALLQGAPDDAALARVRRYEQLAGSSTVRSDP